MYVLHLTYMMQKTAYEKVTKLLKNIYMYFKYSHYLNMFAFSVRYIVFRVFQK